MSGLIRRPFLWTSMAAAVAWSCIADEASEASDDAASAAEVEAESESSEVRNPVPARAWAMRENIRYVQVSPSGRHVAFLSTPPEQGNPTIVVLKTEDLSTVLRQSSDPMEILQFRWISDDVIIFVLRQVVRDDIEGFNRGVFEFRISLVDVAEQKMTSLGEVGAGIVNVLPKEPDHVLIASGRDTSAVRTGAYRPVSYHKFNLKTGNRQLVIQGKIDKRNIRFDPDGIPLFATGYHRTRLESIWYWRRPGTKGWKEIYGIHRDSFDYFSVEGVDPENPNYLLVSANNGHNTIGLWVFDPESKSFVEPVYRRGDVDISGVRYHSNDWKHPGLITAVAYQKDTVHFKYLDASEEAMFEQLAGLIDQPGLISVSSRAMDVDTMVALNRGSKDPGTYYLLHDGKLRVFGSLAPQISSEDLSDLSYITYTSRDGKTVVPGYLTTPKGEPPFPLVVLPHGGPWVAETVIYDPWSQMFANHGYMVLQPQYRGSRKYGIDYWLSSFEDGSQMGYAMQDDKDDGANYLVEKGLVDPDRIAMAGWSYGGYAALVAAARTPQIYQCVIAGAPVADPILQVNYYRTFFRGKTRQLYSEAAEKAFSPLKEAENVNIPVLLVHGEVDQRVPLEHTTKYIEKLKEFNKPHEFLLLEGADHFYSTLTFDHRNAFYSRALSFLRDDCGPDGL